MADQAPSGEEPPVAAAAEEPSTEAPAPEVPAEPTPAAPEEPASPAPEETAPPAPKETVPPTPAEPAPETPAVPESQKTVTEEAPPAPEVTETAKPPPPEVLERVGEKKDLDEVSEEELKAILKSYYDKWVTSEGELYDISHVVRVKDMQIHELEMEVSDMRGKFIIPKLKKVHTFKLMGENE